MSAAGASGEGTPLAPAGLGEAARQKLRERCPTFFGFSETWSPEKARGTLDPWGFTVCLAAEMFPRGVLPLAAGFTAVGVPYTLLLGGVVYAAAIFSMWAVGRVSEATGEVTWRGQWSYLLGSRTAFVPLVCVVITTLSSCSCTLAAAAALASDLSILPFGRLGVLVVMVGMLLRFVTTRRNYVELEAVATVAIGSAAVSALVVLWRACDGSYLESGTFGSSVYAGSAYFKNGPLDVVPHVEMVVLLSLLCNAFLVHHNSCKLYRELQRGSAAEHWTWTQHTFNAVLLAYFVVMAAGAWLFGAQAQAVILDNFASTDFLGGLAKLASAVALLCSVPLTFAALREATSDLISDWSPRGKEALEFASGQNLLAVVLVSCVVFFACQIDSPYQVVALTGCFFGACCAFILPCVLLQAVHRIERAGDGDGHPRRESTIVAWVLCLGGVVCLAGAVAPIAQRSYFFAEYEPHDVFTQVMSNVDDVQYYGQVTIGGQQMSAIMDTGSSEFVVLSDRCKGNCGDQSLKLYHADESPTHWEGDLQLQLTYGSGTVLGSEAYDSVQIGPMRANQVPFWEGIEAEMKQLLAQSSFQAIAGLGPTSPDTRLLRPLAAGNERAWAALLPAMGVRRFSICLGRLPGSDGYIVWNDDARSKDPVLFQKVPVPPTGYWMAHLTDVRLGGTQVACGRGGCGGIVDSGTSLMAMPKEHLKSLREAIVGLDPDCRLLGNLPPLTFRLGGVPLSLSADAYLAEFEGDADVHGFHGEDKAQRGGWNRTNQTERSCQPSLVEVALTTSMGPTWILGMPFLREYYTVFVQGAKFTPAAMYVAPASKDCRPRHHSVRKGRPWPSATEEMRRAESEEPAHQARRLRWGQVRLPGWARRHERPRGRTTSRASSALRGARPAATAAMWAQVAEAAAH